jgi:glycosyltransferase involved in cell wall biosynthesis
VVVNPPHSGDIEQIILEAQSCGVPLLHTDDQAVMAEAVGAGGVLMPAGDIGTGRTGERHHHVPVATIVDAVVTTVRDGELRAKLTTAGRDNAARYGWATLRSGISAAVAQCLRQTR